MRHSALLVVCCLVLAGCNAPTTGPAATDTPAGSTPTVADTSAESTPTAHSTPTADSTTASVSTTATEPPPTSTAERPASPEALAAQYDIDRDAGVPTNVSLVFARTALLLDRPGVEPPSTVEVRGDAGTQVGPARYPPFFETLGIEPAQGTPAYPAFVATPDRIVVNRNLTQRPTLLAATLSQEAVHVVQFRDRTPTTLRRAVPGSRTTVDGSYVVTALLEGTAVYTQAAYQRRYQNATTTRIDTLGETYRNQTTVGRISYGIYYFGAQYVRDRVDDPAEIDSVYDDPPATTEQLLHGPGAGPEANLPVEIASDGWESASRRRTTFGELFLRGTLATRLSEEAAADAAAGWGTDERLVFTRDGETGYVWLHRWDDPANATEFRGAFDSYLNRTLNRSTVAGPDGPTAGWRGDGETYRLLRLDDQTTALVAGSPAFVGNTTLRADDGTAAVRVENESGAQTPNSNGTPKTTSSPTSATSVPTPTAPAPNDCIGLVTRSSSNSR